MIQNKSEVNNCTIIKNTVYILLWPAMIGLRLMKIDKEAKRMFMGV